MQEVTQGAPPRHLEKTKILSQKLKKSKKKNQRNTRKKLDSEAGFGLVGVDLVGFKKKSSDLEVFVMKNRHFNFFFSEAEAPSLFGQYIAKIKKNTHKTLEKNSIMRPDSA